MIECTKILHVQFLYLWDSLIWIFYDSCDTFTFYSLIRIILIVYGKIHIRFAPKVSNLFRHFGRDYHKFFSFFIIVEPDRLNIRIAFFINGSELQIQFAF